ncbi:hypothetical protein [Paracoccus actinidiae]|uniref:hypothetical protein n=1 Tax=Paracoccus actinidiae TaxID=3064531 RepID=UPI0027D2DC4C|nr:hypothetical protein [Paracoccus sp. M09]
MSAKMPMAGILRPEQVRLTKLGFYLCVGVQNSYRRPIRQGDVGALILMLTGKVQDLCGVEDDPILERVSQFYEHGQPLIAIEVSSSAISPCSATRSEFASTGRGVVQNFAPWLGTGAGSNAQDMTELEFSE